MRKEYWTYITPFYYLTLVIIFYCISIVFIFFDYWIALFVFALTSLIGIPLFIFRKKLFNKVVFDKEKIKVIYKKEILKVMHWTDIKIVKEINGNIYISRMEISTDKELQENKDNIVMYANDKKRNAIKEYYQCTL